MNGIGALSSYLRERCIGFLSSTVKIPVGVSLPVRLPLEMVDTATKVSPR